MHSNQQGRIVRERKDLRGGINAVSAFINARNRTKMRHDGVTI